MSDNLWKKTYGIQNVCSLYTDTTQLQYISCIHKLVPLIS